MNRPSTDHSHSHRETQTPHQECLRQPQTVIGNALTIDCRPVASPQVLRSCYLESRRITKSPRIVSAACQPLPSIASAACVDRMRLISRVHNRLRVCGSGRLEASYAIQQKLEMIPLMMQEDYSPNGWLGLILGSACRSFTASPRAAVIMQMLSNQP